MYFIYVMKVFYKAPKNACFNAQNALVLLKDQKLLNLRIQRVPALRGFWDLKKTALRKIRVSGTVGDPLLTRKSPTCAYISQKPR